jgi:TRAP-type uncharacterized transport system substrate-binding protein
MPNATVQRLSASTPSVLVQIPDTILARMIESNPGYRSAVIPGTSYPGWASEERRTVAVSTSLVTTAGCPIGHAFEIVRTVYENRRELSMMSPLYQRLDACFATEEAQAPIHPGALEYFNEYVAKTRTLSGRGARGRS